MSAFFSLGFTQLQLLALVTFPDFHPTYPSKQGLTLVTWPWLNSYLSRSWYIKIYTMMWKLCALWLWSIRGQIQGWRHGNLVFFVLFKMARGFENLSRSYLQRTKMEKRRHKELFTTWERLNYTKFSQQLPSCVIATRDSLFCKMFSPSLIFFEREKTLKNFSKKLY